VTKWAGLSDIYVLIRSDYANDLGTPLCGVLHVIPYAMFTMEAPRDARAAVLC
jgi:hypothetical protein